MIETNDGFQELMAGVREGSEDAARKVVEQYEPMLRRALRRVFPQELRSKLDSLDLVQGVLGSFFRRRGRLDDIRTPEQLAAFLAGMGRNKILREERHYRTGKRQVGRESPLADMPGGESNLPDREPSHVEMLMLMEKWDAVLKSRSQRDRRIVQLRTEGLTWEAIGKSLEIDANHAQRIVAMLLREAFEK